MALINIRAGEYEGSGYYPKEYLVNVQITPPAGPEFLRRWQFTDRGSYEYDC
jgi:hypothetical protein